MSNPVKITAEPGKQELFITREFDATPELVFRAFNEPGLLVKWLGPKNMEMTIDYYESKSGGRYRYVHTDGQGNSYAFNGAIHEVTAPERLIQTFEFEGMPKGHVCLDTATFEALPAGRTKLTIHSVYRFVEDRDGMIQSGMEGGLRDGFEKLDELLKVM